MQRLAQLERDNQRLRRELEQAKRLLSAPDRPALDAAMESGLKVGCKSKQGGMQQQQQYCPHYALCTAWLCCSCQNNKRPTTPATSLPTWLESAD